MTSDSLMKNNRVVDLLHATRTVKGDDTSLTWFSAVAGAPSLKSRDAGGRGVAGAFFHILTVGF
jgi:hypothetical protein